MYNSLYMIWYKQKIKTIYETLNTSELGLTELEAKVRLKKYGPNQLAIKGEPLWRIIVEPFRSVFVGVLMLAALVSVLSHEALDAVVIATIIVINAAIFYTQQYTTGRVLRSLKKHSLQDTVVSRNNKQLKISSADLVPGDIIYINEGDRVPADARIIHIDNLQINESSLTGESMPVRKKLSTLSATKRVYEQRNMLFQGTYVTAGTGKALVVGTGDKTEFSKIAELATGDHAKSPVQIKIDYLITMVVKAVGLMAVIAFILGLARGIPPNEALRFVLTLSVSAVPEGLPVALSVIVILGMRRMAKQKALVRSFKAIEDIGLITTIATDKTGTLTKNHLTVIDSWPQDSTKIHTVAASTIDYSANTTDPLDNAIAEYTGGDTRCKIGKLYAFNIALRMSGAYIAKEKAIYIKGAPEHILAKSVLSKEERYKAESAMHKLTSRGYRVLAFGLYKINCPPPKDLTVISKRSLEFVGFLAFADELRPEAARAIKLARKAGINVLLITGDHCETAFNIGKELGLAEHPNQIIQGIDLPKKQQALALAIQGKTIFSRILPDDKYRILQSLKETEITAMTGDGVNDVPALASAHIGIAMGSGSDIARDTGDIVLLNDNFATLTKTISEGRKIFDNIRRMLFYLLSTSLGEVATMIGALLFNLPLPVTAIQILWINLVTDTAMVIPLGLEPEEDGHMEKPPRRPNSPLLGKLLLTRMILVSLTMALVTLIIIVVLESKGHSLGYIQTVAFMALIVAQWTNALNARAEHKSSFTRIKKANYGMLVGFLIAFSLQMLVMFGPLREMFGIVNVPYSTLLISSFIMAISVLLAVEMHKAFAVKNNR